MKIGKNKVNKNLPAGISGQSGVENTILVDADNLETLESSLGTEETSKCRFGCVLLSVVVCYLLFFFFPLKFLLICSFFMMKVFPDSSVVHLKTLIFLVLIRHLMFRLYCHMDALSV